MIEILAGAPLLTVFLVVAVGTLVGAIPFGPLKFGPAGALFVGLAVGALDPRLGEGFGIIQSIGLALFVYTIGLAAGATFFRDLKKQGTFMLGATVLLAAYAGLVVAAGKLTGFGGAFAGGLFAGSMTATPALAAATSATGSSEPAVGYAITYPIGVIVTMIVLTFIMKMKLPAQNDQQSSVGLRAVTVEVERDILVQDIPGIAEIAGQAGGEVRVSYHWRDGHMSVARPKELLRKGDQAVFVGTPKGVERAIRVVGKEITGDKHLLDDRRHVNFRRFLMSDPSLAGRTVTALRIPDRFDGLITRVIRGDEEMLAHAEMKLQQGDRLLVVAPKDRFDELKEFFGDSEKKVTEVDFWSMGLGIALGVAVGLISLPIGGASLALGSAAGPLVVGLILGYARRSGPIVWTIPTAANLTIRQLGLVLFLAAVGLASGQDFASTAFSALGIKLGIVAATLLLIILLAFWLLGRFVGLSTARVAGGMAGFVGQPALLNHVNSTIDDQRTEAGYSAMFALGIIVKIMLVQVVVAF